ncbi:hypothetical protein AB5I41_04375 [Sphingomonas sp. MMS24-JH45]
MVAAEAEVTTNGLPIDAAGMRRLKSMGRPECLAWLALQSANLRGMEPRHRARIGPDPRGGEGDDRRRHRGRGARASPEAGRSPRL